MKEIYVGLDIHNKGFYGTMMGKEKIKVVGIK
jgi:hypothetical protein